ncbi:MAG: C1 family peptidase [Bacteroidales bacterium]|nr:C1 family peptidase [Bacteroidales bacterium]MDD4671680.1 C1 family peptidase [Bacteroidales bacterium]MDY0349389.1 C1 family peptidase [Tenuifilaceae bacterium]
MNRNLFLISLLCLSFTNFSLLAQDTEEKKEVYQFSMEKEVPVTSVKDQYRAGTCWSYSGLGLVEAELLRLGKGDFNLSDIFVVRKVYEQKAKKYVRMHGKTHFAGGGAFHDVFWVIDNYGIIPEAEYRGLEYGEDNHVHGELDAVLRAYVDAVIKNRNRKLSTAWFRGFQGVLDAYLGEVPEKFTYNGKEYTPKSFVEELDFNSDNYINLTSFTHHPFYEPFILEIPDNWLWGQAYNLPVDELMEVLDNAINNGYSAAWGSDVSEKGFKWSRGVAIVPSEDRPDLDGLERAKWEELSSKEKEALLYKFDEPVAEKEITQEMRQIAFDNYQTTDDHGMLIAGIAKDQNGTKYYYVKNSWNTNNIYDGYFYASESFVKYKTMNIVVHKDAIPKKIAKKLNLK